MVNFDLSILRAGCLLALSIAGASAESINHFAIRKPSAPQVAVKGKPYSGQLVTESIMVQPDGTRITDKYVERTEYRDSEGRTRRELLAPPDTKESLRIVTIDDPVAGVEYVLEPKKKIAHQFTQGNNGATHTAQDRGGAQDFYANRVSRHSGNWRAGGRRRPRNAHD